MRNITAPRTVSFEEALRNLASRLTGVPASTLPRIHSTPHPGGRCAVYG